MESGIHYDVSEKEYHSLNYLSGSQLKRLLKSPLHSQVPIEKTPAMEFGSLAHMAFLEPEKFSKRIVTPKFDKRTKDGKTAYEAFMSSISPESVVINEQDNDRVTRMRQVLLGWVDRVTVGNSEVTLIFNLPKELCEVHGLPETKCKARIDLLELTPKGFRIIEYKTTQDASKSAFTKTIANQKYHLSAAWYIYGLSLVTGVPMNDIEFVFLAQETEAPFDWAQYSANDEMLQRGWERVDEALVNYALGLKSDFSVGYDKTLQEINLPLYELSNFN